MMRAVIMMQEQCVLLMHLLGPDGGVGGGGPAQYEAGGCGEC